MPAEVVAGVDVGSSAARAVAIDRDGAVVASSRAPYPAHDGSLAGEVDPAVWLAGLVAALDGLGARPLALGAGGHGPTTVASTGELALTFRHPAGATEGPVGQHAAHLRVLRDRLGDHVEPRQMWDHLLARLGGDPSTQSMWPGEEPLEGFGSPIPAGTAVGTSAGDHGEPEGMTLVPGANDAYMTSWASAIDTPGRAFDPGGKTGGLGVAIRAEGEHAEIAKFGMPSHVPGVAIVGGPVASHGAMMDWWSAVTGRPVAELLDLAADVEPGSHGVMVLPFLEGERAPRWNLGLRAEITGIGAETGVGVLTRALVESTAYGLAHIARDLAGHGIALERVVSSGGPARSPLWTSIKAAVLDVPVDVPDCDEMSAYGAALAAGAALGWWPRPGEGVPGDWPMPEVTTYEPKPLEVYRKGLDRFIELGDEAVARLERSQPNE
ncbi:MAG: hypothetical protein KQH83_01595 [Actinobacteria bacterium]|nr:hypothetical protein [Actinomycetota bacterium]